MNNDERYENIALPESSAEETKSFIRLLEEPDLCARWADVLCDEFATAALLRLTELALGVSRVSVVLD